MKARDAWNWAKPKLKAIARYVLGTLIFVFDGIACLLRRLHDPLLEKKDADQSS